MKTLAPYLVIALAPAMLLAEPAAVPKKITPAQAALEAGPAPVREVVLKALNAGGTLDKFRVVRRGEQTLYIADIDRAEDRDLKLSIRADGSVAKSIEDVPAGELPEAVGQALKALTGDGGHIDDVKKVTEGAVVTFKAEIDRAGKPELDVTVSAEGSVLEQKEDLDD